MVRKLSLSLAALVLLGSAFFAAIGMYIKNLVQNDQLTQDIPEQQPEPFFYYEVGTSSIPKRTEPIPSLPQYTVEIEQEFDIVQAQELVKSLTQKGLDCFYTPMNDRGIVSYHIRSGMFYDLKHAKDQAAFLKKEFKISGKVIRL